MAIRRFLFFIFSFAAIFVAARPLWPGGVCDGIRLFKDLDARVIYADDNGFVRHE